MNLPDESAHWRPRAERYLAIEKLERWLLLATLFHAAAIVLGLCIAGWIIVQILAL